MILAFFAHKLENQSTFLDKITRKIPPNLTNSMRFLRTDSLRKWCEPVSL